MILDGNSEIKYIAIEGVIGAGKTSLARKIKDKLNAQLIVEQFEANPFLESFYSDRKRYAFQTQMFFLVNRFKQQQELNQENLFTEHLVCDYLFEKDKICACRNRVMLELLFSTGMRISELLGLKRDQIDYKTGKSAKYADMKQLDLMAGALFIKHPELETIKSGLAYVVSQEFPKKTHKRENLDTYMSVFDDQLYNLDAAMDNGVFNPKSGPLCGWCPVTSCEHWKPRRK